jgi:hypothetical protein
MNDALETIRHFAATSDDLPGDQSYLAARGVGLNESQASIYAEAREDGLTAQDALRYALRTGR